MVLLAALPCIAVQADSIQLGSAADATLIEDPTGEYALGAAYNVYAGRVGDNGGATIRRGLMRFNFSAIPAGSTITSVTLRLSMSQTQSGSQTVGLHRCSLPWTEGTAFAFGGAGANAGIGDSTWNYQVYPTVLWPTPGGVFTSTPSATKSVSSVGFYTWNSTAALVADVQGWINNPSSNHGWVIKGNEATATTVKRFDAREASANQPLLVVNYLPPSNRPADLNSSGVVDGADLAILLGQWGQGAVSPADLSLNGVVDGGDLAILLGDWG
ncbi:MAG: DNRLRE domain-containing protein [Planctomycetes bacterium]|nr:DNRLRE domain-containing protein [Planctomycetota bacterium]